MKIYTRTGDDGTTGLFGGIRIKKNDARVEAYGTVDEANATLGIARAAGVTTSVDALLEQIQKDLFTLGAELACAPGKEQKLQATMRLIDPEDATRLERAIDTAEEHLQPLKSFILPAGTPAAAALHLARTVSRRAERRVIEAAVESPIRNELVVYLNRLSDLLFVLARQANFDKGVPDVPWHASDAPSNDSVTKGLCAIVCFDAAASLSAPAALSSQTAPARPCGS